MINIGCEEDPQNHLDDLYGCLISYRAMDVEGKESIFHKHVHNAIHIDTNRVGFHRSSWDEDTPTMEVSFREEMDGKVSCSIRETGLNGAYHNIECHKEE